MMLVFILFSETDTDFTLTASHSMRLNNTIQVTVDRIGYGKRCTPSSNTDANVTIFSSNVRCISECNMQKINDLTNLYMFINKQ